jgi:hypothetical protein
VAAPEFRGESIRVAARLAVAALLFVMVANGAASPLGCAPDRRGVC